MLELENLCSGYGRGDVLHGVSLRVGEGESLFITGPNGCGKTTLLRCIAGLQPYRGNVTLDGRDARSWRRKELARRVGLMTQLASSYFPYTVYDTVAMGRYAHLRGPLASPAPRDREVVEACMEQVGIADLRERRIGELSGGQLQRVYLARLFAQDPQIALLDEPTNHLDLSYQIELLEYITSWSSSQGKTVIGVLHDLNLVHAYAGRVVLLSDGSIAADGPPGDALSAEHLRACYHSDVAGWMRRSLQNWA